MTLYQELNTIFSQQTNKLVIEKPRSHFFQQSPRISTYLYAIIAGNFVYSERIKEGFPPMRVYAR
jgi:aminopeptidase N